ncbi:TPA: hypothetical protein ACXNQV_000064 [Stenotrophomonas maltophilia]
MTIVVEVTSTLIAAALRWSLAALCRHWPDVLTVTPLSFSSGHNIFITSINSNQYPIYRYRTASSAAKFLQTDVS